MKTWYSIISIVVILALVCSPALAISKSDLISFYKGQNDFTTLSPESPTLWPYPKPVPPTSPTQDVIEPLQRVGPISINSNPPGASVYLDGQYQGLTPIVIRELPIVSSRYPCCEWFTIQLTKTGYKNATISWILCGGDHRTFSVTLTPNQTAPSEYTGEDGYAPWHTTKDFLSF